MAEPTLPPNIVIDPHTLQSVTRAVCERVSLQGGLNALQLVEQLRLLFVDSHQGLFVFGAPDELTLVQANLHARAALEKALGEIFPEETRVELVRFDESQGSPAALIADLSAQAAGGASPAPPAAHETSVTEEQAPGLNSLQLGLLQNSLRGVFTSPKRVVVVPGYLLRWLPYLGPLRTSIVVACFQAFYLCRRTTARPEQTFEAPGPLLAALAGIAESSLWRHLDDPQLGWFLQKVPYQPDEKRWVRDERAGVTKKRPTRFLFRATSPLTPGDAQALRSYLQDLNIRENPVRVLTDLVRGEYRVEPRDVFAFPPPPPTDGWESSNPDQCLIHTVIFAALASDAKTASKELVALVDELVERLLPANDQLHLSWYYLLHWQALLGHGPAWAISLLRDRCFYNRQTGELRDTVSLRGGYQELAGALGLQRVKTAREWFPAPHAQKEELKNADLASPEALEQIAQSKRGFVRAYAARFVEISAAEADGRGQVSAFKAQVRLFDPLTPAHEALYKALFPLAQRFFALPHEHKTAFLNAFDEIAELEADSLAWLVQESSRAAAEIVQKHAHANDPEHGWQSQAAVADFLGAIERITEKDPGAKRGIAGEDPGAPERITPVDAGAIESITPPDLGGFERLAGLISGAFERITGRDAGAIEGTGRVFWAQMRGLKHLVLNHRFSEALKDYLQNTDLEKPESAITTPTTDQDDLEGEFGVGVEADSGIETWDLDKLLENFSPHIRQGLVARGVTVQALVSCLLYIASSKGDNLGLGYVVERLKARPQEGQGGIYLRLAGGELEEIVAKLRAYLDYRSFQSREWRVAMGSPSGDKILELLEHLGLDSSQVT